MWILKRKYKEFEREIEGLRKQLEVQHEQEQKEIEKLPVLPEKIYCSGGCRRWSYDKKFFTEFRSKSYRGRMQVCDECLKKIKNPTLGE